MLIGNLSACIGYDSRYTDVLNVSYDSETDTVEAIVKCYSPMGGMDGDETPYMSGGCTLTAPASDVKKVVEMVQSIVKNDRWNFKRYGKPSKNMEWYLPGGTRYEPNAVYGLSSAKVKQVLDAVRGA